MKTILASIAIAIGVAACAHRYPLAPNPSVLHPNPTPSALPSVLPSQVPSPVPSASPSPAPVSPVISVGLISGATQDEIKMVYDGVDLINQLMARPCFKQWVLAANYTENNGLTQPEIWDTIVRHNLSVNVEIYTGTYYQNHVSRTIGYENDPFDGVVHMNRYFVNTPYMVADNLVHEDKGHSAGFHHYDVYDTSEPYGMNYAFEGCSNQQQQAKGSKAFKPPGIRLEHRHNGKRVKRKVRTK